MVAASIIDGGKAMANAEIEGARRGSPWRAAGWSVAGLVLLLPLLAMQFTREVDWTVGDLLFAAMMFGLVGLTLELAVRASRSISYRGGVAAAVAASFLIVWATGAGGRVGKADNHFHLRLVGEI